MRTGCLVSYAPADVDASTRPLPLEDGLALALQATEEWPWGTLIVRGDSPSVANLDESLAKRPNPSYQPPLHGWSVQSKPWASKLQLCIDLPNRTIRVTTLGNLLDAGGRLAKTPGRHEHCTVVSLDASTFHRILSAPERNPYFPDP